MFFASDNGSGVPEAVLAALVRVNEGAAPGYGADEAMAEVTARLRSIFEAPKAEVFLIATGTAANAIAIASFCPPWGTVYCHDHAHVEEDECGAPEFYTGGAKLRRVPGPHGRMDPDALRAAIAGTGTVGVHNVQRGMVSITETTEAGTIHGPDGIAELVGNARDFDLPVHMDGARFANALVAAGCTPAELTWKAGVDILSFGGTKNGLMGVEALILFDPDRHAGKGWEIQLRRKRGGHLFSKHRYLSAQMLAYLRDDLWLDLARRANAAAARLAAGLAQVPGARFVHPVQANAIFAAFPRAAHRRAHAAGARYYMWPFGQSLEGDDDEALSCRLVCSWNTTEAEVAGFLEHLRG